MTSLQIIVVLLLMTVCAKCYTDTDTITFAVQLVDGGEITYVRNKTDTGNCVYTKREDKITCVTKHSYKNVVDTWKYNPSEISYIAINCMNRMSNNHHICICVNGSDAVNSGKYKQNEDIHYCHLTMLEERMFSHLLNLEVLDLSSNAIRSVENGSFDETHSLKYIDLSYNPIDNLESGLFCGSLNLEILKLINITMKTDAFHRLFSNCEADLEKLIYIDLSNNDIQSIPNQLFEHLPNVETLILRGNAISYISESAFFGASRLKVLDLLQNHLPAVPRAFCDFLYQIKYVNIASNHLTNFNMNDITKCETVENLDISNNQIKYIMGTLASRSDLKVFNLSRNDLERVSDDFLQNTSSLVTLDLSFNNLYKLSASVVSNLTNLKQLNLQGNKINDTKDIMEIFNETQNLLTLNISSNGLQNVANGTFEALENLISLDLSHNNISITYANTFKGLRSLKTLMLHHNKIADVNKTSLSPLISLTTIDLSHNRLTTIDHVSMPLLVTNVNLEQNSFSSFPSCFNNTSVKRLNLRSNAINDMAGNLTKDLQNLEMLDLSYNELISLENVLFINMPSLNDLNLSFNDISSDLSTNVFLGTENLTILNLQKNYISNIDNFFSYSSAKTITHLDLSYNVIERIEYLLRHDTTNQSDHRLRELNLDHGSIHHIATDAFLGFLNLRTVNLQNNKIKEFQPFNIAYGTEFMLQSNPLHCSCSMSWLADNFVTVHGRKVSTFDYEVETCTVEPDNITLPVRNVPKHHFLCRVQSGCDSMCACFSYKTGDTIDYIDCNGLIGYMPETLSRDATIIYLDGNRLPILKLPQHYKPNFLTTELYLNKSQVGIVDDIFFSAFDRLEILDLSHNEISSLPSAIFDSLINLKKLYLSNNAIMVVQSSWIKGLPLQELHMNNNDIRHVQPILLTAFDKMHDLRDLQLHNNPFSCDCENKDFRLWLKTSGKVVYQKYDIQCANDKRPLLSVSVAEFDCPVAKTGTDKRGITTVVVVVFVCSVILTAVSIYYRRDIAAVVYVKLGMGCLRHKYEINKPYDAYLVYDTHDSKCSDWVNKSLMTFLQKRKNPYKIVTTDRSKIVSSIVDIDTSQLHDSKCCLFIINSTVMSNSWCVESFHRAWAYASKYQKFKLIIIVLGDIDINLLEHEMRLMLSKGQYITARSITVWDRLIYELPNPETGFNSLEEDDVSDNEVIIFSATGNNSEEYGSVSIE